jgi:hypothetical protein
MTSKRNLSEGNIRFQEFLFSTSRGVRLKEGRSGGNEESEKRIQ